MLAMKLEFPKHFYWGAATASHQVEADNHNDWSEWEHENADRLAHASEQTFRWNPRWQAFKPEATRMQNYISGRACDHYHRFAADFDLAQDLGHNAHRFSIEWSRIEPREGEFNPAAITHYQAVIAALRSRGIEPFVTLWHWTLPLWLLWLAPVSLALSVLSRLAKVITGGEKLSEPSKEITRTEKLIYEILGAITLGFFIGATGLGIWAVYLSASLLTFKLILGAILLIQSFSKTEPNS